MYRNSYQQLGTASCNISLTIFRGFLAEKGSVSGECMNSLDEKETLNIQNIRKVFEVKKNCGFREPQHHKGFIYNSPQGDYSLVNNREAYAMKVNHPNFATGFTSQNFDTVQFCRFE